MVDIYISLDENKVISSYGKAEYGPITDNPNESILITVDDNHEILKGGIRKYRLSQGLLIKDDAKILEDTKINKKQELNNDCRSRIIDGFDVTIDDTTYQFTYKEEDQLNFQETYWLFANDNIESIVWSVKNNGESDRVRMNKHVFSEVYMASVKHKQNMISKLKDSLYPIIDDASSVEMVEHITWDTIVVEPELPPVVIKSDNTLPIRIDSLKLNQAESSAEIINLVMSMLMGGMM